MINRDGFRGGSSTATPLHVEPLLAYAECVGFGRIEFASPVQLQPPDFAQILDELEAIMNASPSQDFLVDLQQLDRVGRTGLIFFLTLRDHARIRSGRCVFFGASPAVAVYIQEHLLDELLDIVEDEPSAIRVLEGEKPAAADPEPVLRSFASRQKLSRYP